MKRSAEKILTTHVGSLPNQFPLESGDAQSEDKLPEAVAAVAAKQHEIGLDCWLPALLSTPDAEDRHCFVAASPGYARP